MAAPFIEGLEVLLRPVTPADIEGPLAAWVNDREVTRYLVRGTFPSSVTAPPALAGSGVTDVELCIVTRAEGRTIGQAGLHALQWVPRHAEFRILIGETEYWGRGIGTEVCHLLLAYAFEILNLNKIWLGVNAANARAKRSYEKVGFVTEGLLRDEVYRNGRYFDVVRMSIRRGEYDAVVSHWPTYPAILRQFRTSEPRNPEA